MQTRADDRWHCIWELTESGNSLAYVESPRLAAMESAEIL